MKFSSTSIKGYGTGKKLGFPTINLHIPPELVVGLVDGVYAVWATVDKERYPGAMHFGPIPTFGQTEKSLQIHLINALYISVNEGDEVECEIVKYIRPVMNFGSPELLVQQLIKDEEAVKDVLHIV